MAVHMVKGGAKMKPNIRKPNSFLAFLGDPEVQMEPLYFSRSPQGVAVQTGGGSDGRGIYLFVSAGKKRML